MKNENTGPIPSDASMVKRLKGAALLFDPSVPETFVAIDRAEAALLARLSTIIGAGTVADYPQAAFARGVRHGLSTGAQTTEYGVLNVIREGWKQDCDRRAKLAAPHAYPTPAPHPAEPVDCYGRPVSVQRAEGCKCIASGLILMTGDCPVHGEAEDGAPGGDR